MLQTATEACTYLTNSECRASRTAFPPRSLETLVSARGPPPEGHVMFRRVGALSVDNQPTSVTYKELASSLKSPAYRSILGGVLDGVSDKTLYRRVYNWCKDKARVSVRAFNEEVESAAKTELKAARCMGTLDALARAMRERGVGVEGVADFDETSMRIFGNIFVTLHWRGAKNVPIPRHHRNKLTLSVSVVWFADGTLAFIVVWSDPKTAFAREDKTQVRWTREGDVWFMEACSKMTRKTTYGHILNFLLCHSAHDPPVEILVDDDHGAHKCRNADGFLGTLEPPVTRVRIQGRCTAELAPADQSATNKRLKQITNDVLGEVRLEECLRGEANVYGKLTKGAREACGLILTRVRSRFNQDAKTREKAQHAFQHTLFCRLEGNKPNNRLGKLSVGCFFVSNAIL